MKTTLAVTANHVEVGDVITHVDFSSYITVFTVEREVALPIGSVVAFHNTPYHRIGTDHWAFIDRNGDTGRAHITDAEVEHSITTGQAKQLHPAPNEGDTE